MKKIISLGGMSCQHCVAHVEKALKALPGSEKVEVDLKKNLAELQTSGVDDDAIRAAITDAGYEVTAIISN
jgi:copper ion binding protein